MTALNGFPSTTTAGQGLFAGASSVGMIQGQADPDPSTRNALRGCIVAASATLPMWGGVLVSELVPPLNLTTAPRQPLGPVVDRAATLANAIGFSVFDQSYNMVTDPANPVPTAGSGQTIGVYALGSRARIAVACDPSLISLRAGLINAQVSWDYVNQRLVPYSATYAANAISNAVWASTGGGQITFTVGTDQTALINAGDDINVTGVVNTGGASTSAFNGAWTVLSITSSTIVVAAPAAATIGTYASGGTTVAGGGALPVTVLDVQPTGCITVSYDVVTGLATYNYNGACAKIQLTGGTTA